MKEGVESLGQVRTQALVLLAIAFLAGAFVGGTLERVMVRPGRGGGARGGIRGGGPPPLRASRPPGALPFYYDSLNLTAEQHAKIEAILSKRTARLDAAVETACAVIRPMRDSTRSEADAVLTAGQVAKRDSMFAAFASRGGARGGGQGFGGGARGGGFSCGPSRSAAAAKK
jgi:hypothetical protein